MALIERSFDYTDTIKVSRSDFDLILGGTKTCTVRVGIVGVRSPEVWMTDRERRCLVEILRVDNGLRLRDLDDATARAEGFATADELKADLEVYYGRLDPDQPISAIHFTVRSGEPGSARPN